MKLPGYLATWSGGDLGFITGGRERSPSALGLSSSFCNDSSACHFGSGPQDAPGNGSFYMNLTSCLGEGSQCSPSVRQPSLSLDSNYTSSFLQSATEAGKRPLAEVLLVGFFGPSQSKPECSLCGLLWVSIAPGSCTILQLCAYTYIHVLRHLYTHTQ